MGLNSATIPNPALKPLEILVGKWTTVGQHPYFPDVKLRGEVVFEWIEGGAFLKMTSEIDHPKFPTGMAIIGSDNETGELMTLYFDEREISRIHKFSLDGRQWKWWRDDPKFSQRYTVEISDDGNTMTGRGEMRREGSDWEGDLDLTYTKDNLY